MYYNFSFQIFLDRVFKISVLLMTIFTSIRTKPTQQKETILPNILAEVTSSVKKDDLIRDGTVSGQCSQPNPDDLKKQLAAHHVGQKLHPSYYLLPQLHPVIQSKLSRSGSAKEFTLYGSQECPRSLHDIGAEKSVQGRSLCPWYNVLSHDPNRYPVDLVEARCKCTSCVGVDSKSGAGCEPVYYNVPVLWRANTCLKDGSYKYDKGWEKIAVGCTCAMASSA